MQCRGYPAGNRPQICIFARLGVAFFATGPSLGLIMYIITTLEFPMYNIDFHLLTAGVNAKNCY